MDSTNSSIENLNQESRPSLDLLSRIKTLEEERDNLEQERNKRLQGELTVIAAKKRVDEELMRMKSIQEFVGKALMIREPKALTEFFLETIVEAFECENVFLLSVDKLKGKLIVEASFDGSGLDLTLPFLSHFAHSANVGVIQDDSEMLSSWKQLGLISGLACSFVSADSKVIGVVVAGNTKAGIGIYPELEKAHSSTFSVLVSKASSLRENLILEKQVELHVEELEKNKKQLEKANLQLKEMADSFARFVPKDFLHHLNRESIPEVELGDQSSSSMTVMFSDIRGFTGLSEGLDAKEIFALLNDYLGCVVPKIRSNGGFVDKYLGDGIMALFPNPADAILGAIDMLNALNSFNQKRKNPIKVGIGLHTGPLILGTLGDPSSFQCTVISDAVNLAARIEGLTKKFSCSLMVSKDTLEASSLEDKVLSRSLGLIKVQGKKKGVELFQIFNSEKSKTQEGILYSTDLYKKALDLFQKGQFLESSEVFKQVLELHPGDVASLNYIEECKKILVAGIPSTWDGALQMKEK